MRPVVLHSADPEAVRERRAYRKEAERRRKVVGRARDVLGKVRVNTCGAPREARYEPKYEQAAALLSVWYLGWQWRYDQAYLRWSPQRADWERERAAQEQLTRDVIAWLEAHAVPRGAV